jgi:hypothetical protein
MQGDRYFIAMASQRLINGIIHDLKHQMVQTGAIIGVTDVHPGALANGIQTL